MENAGRNNSFSIFETVGSEVERKNTFNGRYTKHVPDYFFIFLFVSVFCISTGLDVSFTYLLFIEVKHAVFGILFFLTTWTSIFCMIMLDDGHKWAVEGKSQAIIFMLAILHLECLFIGIFALKKMYKKPITNYGHPNSHKIFHITDENLSFLKIYCFLSSVLKCIPQIIILSVFLSYDEIKVFKLSVLFCQAIIFHNIVIFSFTVSILFPVRKSARVFLSINSAFINAASKFLATMSACCLFLTIFSQTFKSMGYYAFILQGVRLAFTIWPSSITLLQEYKSCNRPKTTLIGYLPLLCVAFTFIYVHPFAKKGQLIYYALYLMNFLYDLFCLYVFTPAEFEHTVLVYSLVILLGGFASLYGLINLLHMSKSERSLEVTRADSPDI